MAIDINFNNQNKHWVLVVLGKIKNGILCIGGLILKCIVTIGKFIKKIWKLLVGAAILAIIVFGGIEGYDYYKYTYVPEKLLKEAIEDIEHKFLMETDSIKYDYAYAILRKDYKWGYDDVEDYDISTRLTKYHSEAFKYIESKAYEGNAKSQYLLGQIYRWAGDYYHYASQDFVKAAYWWNEAALQSYTPAYNNLGIAYKQGEGVAVDLKKAVHYLKTGAEAGEDWAQRNYGDLFVDGVKIKVGSHKETRKSSNGYYGSQKVREYYDYNTNDWITVYKVDVDDYKTLVPKDIEQAKYWWRKSAAQGNEVAKERLQKIYE